MATTGKRAEVTSERPRFVLLVVSATAERKLQCPECDAEYSVISGDHLLVSPRNEAILCLKDGAPLDLLERRGIAGEDTSGRPFSGVVYVTIVEGATRADLDK